MVHNAEQPVHLVGVAVDRVRNLLAPVDPEMIRLASHGPETADLPEQPLADGYSLPWALAAEAARLVGEILQNRARFEHRNRLALRSIRIDDRRHAVVRRNGEKGRLKLLACAD